MTRKIETLYHNTRLRADEIQKLREAQASGELVIVYCKEDLEIEARMASLQFPEMDMKNADPMKFSISGKSHQMNTFQLLPALLAFSFVLV